MSTLAAADLGPSDDEGDTDFVPVAKPKRVKGAKRRGSGSASSGSDYSSDEDDTVEDDEVKRLREEKAEAEAVERKRRAAEAFRAMQEEDRAGPSAAAVAPKKAEVEMVEIKRPRRFAGETIYEPVMVPKDDPEAVRYFAQQASSKEIIAPAVDAAASSSGTATPTSSSAAPISSASADASKPRPRGPIRKRPRQSLEAMSAALDAGKKMTTLEKSQMDWKSHKSSEKGLEDELAAHRRAGGYLEKQAFLDRVGERREADAEAQNGSSRRR